MKVRFVSFQDGVQSKLADAENFQVFVFDGLVPTFSTIVVEKTEVKDLTRDVFRIFFRVLPRLNEQIFTFTLI